jgi:hypothetical protein
MGACCSKDDNLPKFSFKDCLKNINCKSTCLSACCIKESNVKVVETDERAKHHKHHHKHKHKIDV